MTERKYPSWISKPMTFDEMVEELGNYIAHLLLQTTPYEFVSDAKQEALLHLWKTLQGNPNWIADRGFKTKGGLAWRLAYEGRQQHGAWGPVQRLYEQRVANEATINDWLDVDPEDDTYILVGDRLSTGNTDFWRDLSEIEPRNLEIILYPDGCHPDWRDLADMRIDLLKAIKHVFRNVRSQWYERTCWAIMCLVYGVTIDQAAFMVGISRPSMNHHVIHCRKLMREKLTSYMER